MSCCGKKREALNASNSKPPRSNMIVDKRVNNTKPPGESQTGIVFRYIGNRSLDVRGVYSQRVYRFSTGSPEHMVFAEDVALLRGYPELIEAKKSLVG